MIAHARCASHKLQDTMYDLVKEPEKEVSVFGSFGERKEKAYGEKEIE